MKNCFALSLLGLFTLVAVAAPLRAEDDDKRPLVREVKDREEKNDATKQDPKGRPYRLGVATSLASEVLRAQLKLGEHGLIVEQILEGSPADKAGIEPNDILLSAGDKQLATQDDLVEVMKSSEGKPIEIVLLHDGEKKSVEVRPLEEKVEAEEGEQKAEAAGEAALSPEEAQQLLRRLHGGAQPNFTPQDLQRLGLPGMAPKPLPGNLSVSITRKEDEPAKIKVTYNDKTWEITEKELDQLPADVRRAVAPMVTGHVGAPTPFALPGGPAAGHTRVLRHHQEVLAQQQRMMQQHLERMNEQMKQLQKSIEELSEQKDEKDSE